MNLPKLTSFLSKEPPPVLYHYTSVAGLQGIITSQSFYATVVHYLNDSQEFRHALSHASHFLVRQANSASDSHYKAFLLSLAQSLELIEDLNICVFSLTAEADLLSQWRAYCPPGSGYSMGFRSDGIQRILGAQGLTLGPCTYNEAEQQELVYEVIETAIAPYGTTERPAGATPEEFARRVIPDLFRGLSKVAPFVKHPSFAEEREWRIVSETIFNDHPLIGYRPGRLMLMPYLTIKLSDRPEELPLADIVVGPTPHASLAMNALHGLLCRSDVRCSRVGASKIPYRQV